LASIVKVHDSNPTVGISLGQQSNQPFGIGCNEWLGQVLDLTQICSLPFYPIYQFVYQRLGFPHKLFAFIIMVYDSKLTVRLFTGQQSQHFLGSDGHGAGQEAYQEGQDNCAWSDQSLQTNTLLAIKDPATWHVEITGHLAVIS
jgi:hypothetical protein